MNNFLKHYWAIALLLIFIVITLFPPFNWYLSNSLSDYKKRNYKVDIGEKLPIRSYEFIFNPSVKKVNMEKWEWYYNKSVKKNIEAPLQRTLILHELVLNYILSALVITLCYLLSKKLRLNKVLKQ